MVTWCPTKNLGPIGSAVLTFIGYKQTDRHPNTQTDKPNLYIDIDVYDLSIDINKCLNFYLNNCYIFQNSRVQCHTTVKIKSNLEFYLLYNKDLRSYLFVYLYYCFRIGWNLLREPFSTPRVTKAKKIEYFFFKNYFFYHFFFKTGNAGHFGLYTYKFMPRSPWTNKGQIRFFNFNLTDYLNNLTLPKSFRSVLTSFHIKLIRRDKSIVTNHYRQKFRSLRRWNKNGYIHNYIDIWINWKMAG